MSTFTIKPFLGEHAETLQRIQQAAPNWSDSVLANETEDAKAAIHTATQYENVSKLLFQVARLTILLAEYRSRSEDTDTAEETKIILS